MSWILSKVDSLFATVVAAITGLATSQLLAFIHAYLQRLGGHLDEARRAQSELLGGRIGPVINDEAVRAQIAALVQGRIDALQSAHQAIEQAGVFARPVVFFQHIDQEIAFATARAFHPALPLDMPSLTFGAAGIVFGWLLWELIKAPFALYRRRTTSDLPSNR